MITPLIAIYTGVWILLSGILFVIPVVGLGADVASYYSNAIQILATIVSTIFCIRAMKAFERGDPLRTVWGLIGIGVLSWGIGQMLYTGYIILHNGEETPYPWFSDIGFLMIQPLIIIGLGIFMKAMAVRPPIWGIISAIVVLLLSMFFAFNAIQGNLDAAETSIEYLTYVCYMIFDPILLAMTILTASLLPGGLLTRPWWFCFGGLIFYYLSNRVYDLQNAQNLYSSGSWVDLGWPFSFTLIGVAAILAYDMVNPGEHS
ncbi:hypothetical protein TI03_03325 [Achromatium sp. WMS1]|nr:hypothetical protein TI03_03325 [Achromatium sp. WMS1]